MKRKALITGITGQDGSYLAELLLSKGYEVHGVIRRASTFNTHRIDHIYIDPHVSGAKLFLHYGDLCESTITSDLIWNIKPDEIYHLGAQSHVRVSFDIPEYTGEITALGTTRILESLRRSAIKCKFYQASSSEMFGTSPAPQNENTPFHPQSPYAAAKLYAYWMTVNYRQAYGIFAVNGILFNHESPRRGETFVSRKITRGIANILSGNQKKIYLGNLEARRDWGFAPEYVKTMWIMLQEDKPRDYVIGTGESHSVREFVKEAFGYAGVEIEWKKKIKDEIGVVKSCQKKWGNILKSGQAVIAIDQRYFRPNEVYQLRADASFAKRKLGWQPKIKFKDLVKIMVDYDLKLAGLEPKGEGITISRKKGFNYTEHEYSFFEKIKN